MTAVRPPDYFPRLPYAALLLHADRFVLADTFPFSRQGGHNRARVRTSQGAQWVTVPRRHAGRPLALRDVALAAEDWPRRHLAALRSAYGMAPFYEHVAPGLARLLARPYGSLADLACATVEWTAEWLRAPIDVVRASALPGRPDRLADALRLSGGGPLLTLPESAETDRAQVEGPVRVLSFREGERRQAFSGFVAGLSVLDLVFNYGPASADVLREGAEVGPPIGPA